jgi:CubicO group peptidase (beta-lactamase class C family)
LDWTGLMIERANEGKKLGQFMKQNIWDPLGMSSTTFHLEEIEDIRVRLASMSVRVASGALAPFDGRLLKVPTKDDLGGAGAYSSPSDYIKVLASILRNDEILLKRESVEQMFTPQLTPAQKAAYTNLAHSTPEMRYQLTSGVELGTEVTWGLGGVIIEDDILDGRRKGSLYWSGMPNLHWVSEDIWNQGVCAS